jgi:ABC-type molybdenum transport system ATPase subunit/photorepair protein PhrA
MTLAIFAGSRRVRALQLNGYQLFSRYIHKEGEQVLHISGATVFRQGDADVSRALLRNVQWSIEEGESWAVVGSKKSHLLEVCPRPCLLI